MAPAIWSGSISFGLVNVPVKLYSADHRRDVSFHQFGPKGDRMAALEAGLAAAEGGSRRKSA